MNTEYHIYELIDRYLKGEMSLQEEADFKSKLSGDAVLVETVELQRLAHEFILEREMIELREQIQNDLSAGRFISWRTIIFTVVVTSLVAVGIYFLLRDEKSEESIVQTANISTNENIQENLPSISSSEKVKKPAYDKNIVTPLNEIYSGEINKNIPSSSEIIISEEKVDVQNSEEPLTENENVTIPPLQDPAALCRQTKITAKIFSQPSCTDRPTGSITIEPSSVQGGTAPYLYILDKNVPSKQNAFGYLMPGSYEVTIQDHNGCNVTYTETIVEKECRVINDAFMPSSGETWKLSLKPQYATIQIVNELGVSIYSEKIPTGNNFEWDGRTFAGTIAASGLYKILIQYEGGEIESGYITVLK